MIYIHTRKQCRNKCPWLAECCCDGLCYFWSEKNLNFSLQRRLNILKGICLFTYLICLLILK